MAIDMEKITTLRRSLAGFNDATIRNGLFGIELERQKKLKAQDEQARQQASEILAAGGTASSLPDYEVSSSKKRAALLGMGEYGKPGLDALKDQDDLFLKTHPIEKQDMSITLEDMLRRKEITEDEYMRMKHGGTLAERMALKNTDSKPDPEEKALTNLLNKKLGIEKTLKSRGVDLAAALRGTMPKVKKLIQKNGRSVEIDVDDPEVKQWLDLVGQSESQMSRMGKDFRPATGEAQEIESPKGKKQFKSKEEFIQKYKAKRQGKTPTEAELKAAHEQGLY